MTVNDLLSLIESVAYFYRNPPLFDTFPGEKLHGLIKELSQIATKLVILLNDYENFDYSQGNYKHNS